MKNEKQKELRNENENEECGLLDHFQVHNKCLYRTVNS